MAEEKPKLDPTHADYWVADAEKLKQAADLCWAAKENIKQNSDNAKLFGLDKSLIEAADDAQAELNWLFPNLISFAIQHLAIGILLNRNPRQIIEQGPQVPIVKVVEGCGVVIKEDIKEIINEVENSFKWNEKIPRWSVRLTPEQIQALKRHKATISEISLLQKADFDALYDELKKLALKEVELLRAMEALSDLSNNESSSEPSSIH